MSCAYLVSNFLIKQCMIPKSDAAHGPTNFSIIWHLSGKPKSHDYTFNTKI